MLVIKRNGDRVPFDANKIRLALVKANGSMDEKHRIEGSSILDITNAVWYRCGDRPEISVEEIQDLVEAELLKRGFFEIGKAYIKYRYVRQMARNDYNELMSAVEEKLTARNVQNQNANVDERSFGGRIGEMTSMVMRRYALDYCMSEKAKRNHLGNRIYIHDLDQYAVGSHNCLSIPFDDLLANGFKTRQTDVRPANSINTALQLVAVIFQLQSLNQFGGVSSTHLDWTMVPYVRKSFAKHYRVGLRSVSNIRTCDIDYEIEAMLNDAASYPIDDGEYMNYAYDAWLYAMERTSVEIYQGVEALYHNLNTLQSRSGNQLPFTSINFGTCTLIEGRMFTRALLECSIKGLGRYHKTSIFPCSIFQLMKGVNRKPGDPNYDLYQLALRSTAQRLYPNYANVDWSGNAGYDRNDPRTYFSTMGCRTSNGADINADPGVNPQTKDGRGNACPVTIILPTLAMEARQQVKSGEDVVDVFMEILNTAIDDAKDALLERFEYICSQSAASARFMYENGTMMGYKPEEGIRSALKHCTLAVGQLGLAEALEILVGCNHLSSIGMEVARRIEQLFKEKCAAFKQQYRLNFGVYYTPKHQWVA